MAISKTQPMRPALDDCIDFLNDNLEINDIEVGQGAINAKIAAMNSDINNIENKVEVLQDITLLNVGAVVAKTTLATPYAAQHVNTPITLPDGISVEDVIGVIPWGGILTSASQSSTTVALSYTRWINWYANNLNQIIAHWYVTALNTANLNVELNCTVLYRIPQEV